jgi:hypothetical protein
MVPAVSVSSARRTMLVSCANGWLTKSTLLGRLRSAATCTNAGLHSGECTIHGKDGVAGSIPAGGSTKPMTSGNAGQLRVWGPVEPAMLVVLGFGVRWMGACRMESTSLVNRSGSGRTHSKTLSACGSRAAMKVGS